MEVINRETRTSIYFSMTFVLGAAWRHDNAKSVEFQKALLDNGLEFAQTMANSGSFTLLRNEPSNLQIKLESAGPGVSGLHIISANPQYDLDMFIRDASAACVAYQKTWPTGQYQIIRCAAKIQHLYSCQTHAFKYLWETRLGQSGKDFASLGPGSVAGGGLRLVMPPASVSGSEPRSSEIRIESFLREPGKLLIETGFVWPRPRIVQTDQDFGCGRSLKELEKYAVNEVWAFLTQNKGSQQ